MGSVRLLPARFPLFGITEEEEANILVLKTLGAFADHLKYFDKSNVSIAQPYLWRSAQLLFKQGLFVFVFFVFKQTVSWSVGKPKRRLVVQIAFQINSSDGLRSFYQQPKQNLDGRLHY